MIYISYFYMVRYFTPNLLPLSTACYDPKWYTKHIDKNGVLNGCRANVLHPRKELKCLCPNCTTKEPRNCKFLKEYYAYLRSIDIDWFLRTLDDFLKHTQERYSLSQLTPVFLVHEAPNNLCSERVALFAWFRENGIEVKEFERGDV